MGTERALRLGKALERYWFLRGHVKEGRDLLERALKQSQGVSPAIRGAAMHATVALAAFQGDLPSVVAACEENLVHFRELGDPLGRARSLCR